MFILDENLNIRLAVNISYVLLELKYKHVIAALDKNCSPQHLIQQQQQQFYKFHVFLYLATQMTYVHCLLFLIT